MDKKNTTIGILFMAAAIGVMLYQLSAPRPVPPPVETPATTGAPVEGTTTSAGQAASGVTPNASGPEAGGPSVALPAAAAPAGPAPLILPLEFSRDREKPYTVLENDFVAVHFTKLGGAIAEVVLKKYPETKGSSAPYVLNALHSAPALSFLNFPDADQNAVYAQVSQTADTVTWSATIAGKVEVTRTYTLGRESTDSDPYLIRHTTTFKNLTSEPLSTQNLVLSLGTAEPVYEANNDPSVNVGSYDGDKSNFVGRANFTPSWFSGLFGGSTVEQGAIPYKHQAVWASVKNQFFVSIITPDVPGSVVTAQRVNMGRMSGEPQDRHGLTGSITLDAQQIPANGTVSVGLNFYSGPKEYDRLSKREVFKHNEDIVMEFGWFGFFSKLLLTLLKKLHGLFTWTNWAWGLAIIATTLIVRGALWPLTAASARSSKRMAKIQEPLKAIKEKYKGNQAKQQEETMKLFREHKINPVAGCLPLFIQLPIFFGLFSMLRGASELRFGEFLWISDLSSADTIAHVAGFPINPMPLLMGLSMFFQMRMTPMPTTDNPSVKMMKFMPFMITIFCYTQSSGLAVYWTASNLFTIFQQWVTNRKKDDPAAEVVVAKPGAADRAKPVRDGKATTIVDKKKKK